jgi:hypothetical protein
VVNEVPNALTNRTDLFDRRQSCWEVGNDKEKGSKKGQDALYAVAYGEQKNQAYDGRTSRGSRGSHSSCREVIGFI